jgi:hypothetical protein
MLRSHTNPVTKTWDTKTGTLQLVRVEARNIGQTAANSRLKGDTPLCKHISDALPARIGAVVGFREPETAHQFTSGQPGEKLPTAHRKHPATLQ